MRLRVQMWGNSLALRLPKPFAIEAHIEDNSEVDVSLRNGKIVVAPVDEQLSLDDLVRGISKANMHSAVEWGDPVGKESL